MKRTFLSGNQVKANLNGILSIGDIFHSHSAVWMVKVCLKPALVKIVVIHFCKKLVAETMFRKIVSHPFHKIVSRIAGF